MPRPAATARLALLLSLGSLAGCSTLEPYEAEVESGDRCAQLSPYAPPGPDTQRFYRYRAHVNMGDPLPSSVSTRGGSAIQNYVGRAFRTQRVDSGFSWRTLLVVAQFVLLVVGGFMLLITLSMLGPTANKALRLRNAIVAAVALLLAAVSSYLGGSVVSVDNTSNLDLDVTLNGATYRVPAQSFMDVRVGGFTIDVETRAAGQMVEEMTLHPDGGVGDGILRLLWGHGRFIYSVCGRNQYSMGTAHYGRH